MHETMVAFEDHGERICITRYHLLHQAFIAEVQQFRIWNAVAGLARRRFCTGHMASKNMHRVPQKKEENTERKLYFSSGTNRRSDGYPIDGHMFVGTGWYSQLFDGHRSGSCIGCTWKLDILRVQELSK